MKELTLCAETENLDHLIEFINALLEEKNCPMYKVMELDIAVEELFVNIAHYAYKPNRGDTTIQIDFEEEYVIITFMDGGIPYNPWEREDPDTTLSLEDRKIGGLGVFMVKNSMDEVGYRHENGKNVVTIKKNISNQG